MLSAITLQTHVDTIAMLFEFPAPSVTDHKDIGQPSRLDRTAHAPVPWLLASDQYRGEVCCDKPGQGLARSGPP